MKPIKAIGKFFLGILLFIVSFIIVIFGSPWGVVEFLIHNFYKRRFWKGLGIFGELLLTFAILIDILGGVILQVPFNRLLIKPNGYKFGNKFDTVSFALGMNELKGTYLPLGLKLSKSLSFVDEDHCLKTAENKIEYMKTIIAERESFS